MPKPSKDDVRFALRLCGPLQHLGLGVSSEQFYSQIDPALGPILTKLYRPSTPTLPAHAVTEHPSYFILWLRGIETWGQGTDILEGSQLSGVNLAGLRYAESARRLLVNAGWKEQKYVLLAGHSFGGMAANILAGTAAFGVIPRIQAVHTYGAPRASTSDVLNTAAFGRSFRWVRPNDIVPHVPPSVWEAPAVVNPLTFGFAFRWQQQTHSIPGLIVSDEGVITEVFYDTPLPVITIRSVVAPMIAGDSLLGHTHSVPNYEAGFRAVLGPDPPVPTFFVEEEADEPPLPQTEPDMRAAVAYMLQAYDTSGIGDKPLRVTIPVGHLATVKRVGDSHAVAWEGNMVAVFATKSQARIYARDLNQLNRRGQLAQVLNVERLLTSWNTYLTDATDPTTGFSPVPSPA